MSGTNYPLRADGDIRDALAKCEGFSRSKATEIIATLNPLETALLRAYLTIGNHEGVARICGLKHLDQ